MLEIQRLRLWTATLILAVTYEIDFFRIMVLQELVPFTRISNSLGYCSPCSYFSCFGHYLEQVLIKLIVGSEALFVRKKQETLTNWHALGPKEIIIPFY